MNGGTRKSGLLIMVKNLRLIDMLHLLSSTSRRYPATTNVFLCDKRAAVANTLYDAKQLHNIHDEKYEIRYERIGAQAHPAERVQVFVEPNSDEHIKCDGCIGADDEG